MSLSFSLLPFFITLVNSVWSDKIGGPLLGSMGGFTQFRFTLRGCYIRSVVRPVTHLINFPYRSCQIDPTPCMIDSTPGPNPIDPT